MVFLEFDQVNTISLMNEQALQRKVSSYLKKSDLLFTSTLGSFLETAQSRMNAVASGYGGLLRKGVPDILIFTPNNKYNGFALELKSPAGKGELTTEQYKWLQTLEKECKWFCMVSNDYEIIVETLTKYINNILD